MAVALFSRQETHDCILDSFAPAGGKRPGARLPQNVEVAIELQDGIFRIPTVVALEVKAHARVADVQVFQLHFRQPVGKPGIEEQHIQWRVRIDSKQRLYQHEGNGSRPRLGRVSALIETRKGMSFVSRMAPEYLRQAS